MQYDPPYERPRSENPLDTNAPKKKRLVQGSSSHVGEYSTSQPPLKIDDEAFLRGKLR